MYYNVDISDSVITDGNILENRYDSKQAPTEARGGRYLE
jgi:hypothetical protein